MAVDGRRYRHSAVAVVSRSWSWDGEWIEVGSERVEEHIKASPKYAEGEWMIETYCAIMS